MKPDTSRRLLILLIAAAMPIARADTGDTDQFTRCIPWSPDVQGACPTAGEAIVTDPSSDLHIGPVDPFEEGSFADGQCCYLVHAIDGETGCGCAHSRTSP